MSREANTERIRDAIRSVRDGRGKPITIYRRPPTPNDPRTVVLTMGYIRMDVDSRALYDFWYADYHMFAEDRTGEYDAGYQAHCDTVRKGAQPNMLVNRLLDSPSHGWLA